MRRRRNGVLHKGNKRNELGHVDRCVSRRGGHWKGFWLVRYLSLLLLYSRSKASFQGRGETWGRNLIIHK